MTRIKHNISLIITGAVVLLIALLHYYVVQPAIHSPAAKAGVLDLRGWDFQKEGSVLLNGTWDFYPQRLAGPDSWGEEQPRPIRVPGPWHDGDDYHQPKKGDGTYRLQILLPPLQEKLTVKVQNVLTAHRLYVNGVLIKEMGTLAAEPGGHVARNIPYQVTLEPAGQLDVVFQVSNRLSFDGGLNIPLILGSETAMTLKLQMAFGLDLAVIVLFLLFGMYHLQMYQMRDKDSGYLYSGIYLILLSFGIATSGEKVLMRLLEGLSFQAAYRVQDLSLATSFLIMFMFIHTLESDVMKKKHAILLGLPVVGYVCLIVLSPYSFYVGIKGYMTLYASVLLTFFSCRLVLILMRKRVNKQDYGELSSVVASILFLTAMQVDSILYYTGTVNTNLIGKVSAFGFIIMLNQLLARRYTNKMNEIQRLSEELLRSNEIKDEFLARTSHELKTPLHGVMNISAYLLKESSGPLTLKQRENISLIQDTSMKLAILVHDLIDATKLRYEDMRLEIRTVDLYVVVQIVFRLLSFDTGSKNIRLDNQVKPRTFVEADENRLRQILYNLASNAVRNTEQGIISAAVRIEEGQAILSLSDTGRGIPSSQWEEVFEDSYRNPVRRTQEAGDSGGMGLGLFISRQLARKMKGEVWISRSVPGEGSVLCLRLPVGYSQSDLEKQWDPGKGTDQAKAAAMAPYKGNSLPAHKPRSHQDVKTILIVDDEPANVHVLSLILSDEYELLTAHSGESALRKLQSNKVDLVIADMMMPGMSGIELTEHIRQAHSVIELPIIMATVRSGDGDIELAYHAGANDYIAKPFASEEVQLRIRVLLQLTDAVRTALQHEWDFLQAQIKPHFIYNALSNIVALCYEDGERAAELLARLSRYLRYIFEGEKARNRISLRQELEVIRAYVEIEKLRFGGRLGFEAYLDPALEEAELQIPALLIQPLIENAIRHGLFNKSGPGTVSLSVTEGDGFIRIVVEDDGIGMSDDQVYRLMQERMGGGVGIGNIRRRIEAIPKASFFIHSELEKGTICTLYLPLEPFPPF